MKTLAEQLNDFEFPPFVYSYPPPRMYRSLETFSPEQARLTSEVNIYVHVPFCDQRCTFCPYLTLIERSEGFRDEYVDALVKEIAMRRDELQDKTITTVNFGGGTPSLLTPGQFERVTHAVANVNPRLFETVRELSIETTPEAVSHEKFAALKDLGLNRVSVGVQTLDDQEIRLSKRHNWADTSVKALEILKEIGMPNVCCDLMYGLEGQTTASWEKTVLGILEWRPETIELFALVSRPTTPIGRTRRQLMDNREKYACFSIAREMLRDSGYLHGAHTFSIPNRGGYLQQTNTFKGQSVLGFGVGARTYAETMYFRNTHNTRLSSQATHEYMKNISSGRSAVETGVMLDQEELVRRYAIYNLERLDKNDFRQHFGLDLTDAFGSLPQGMVELGLAQESRDVVELTDKGLLFRDLLSHTFFSESIKKTEGTYWSGIRIRRGADIK